MLLKVEVWEVTAEHSLLKFLERGHVMEIYQIHIHVVQGSETNGMARGCCWFSPLPWQW